MGRGQQAPEGPELRADLSPEVAGQGGVIPDCHAKPYIEHKSSGQLGRDDSRTADERLKPQGAVPRQLRAEAL